MRNFIRSIAIEASNISRKYADAYLVFDFENFMS